MIDEKCENQNMRNIYILTNLLLVTPKTTPDLHGLIAFSGLNSNYFKPLGFII